MSAESSVKRITRPENCVLGFGIPTTAEEFHHSSRYGPVGAFAHRFHGLPAKYQARVIEPCHRLGAQMKRLGARVVPSLTLDRYTSLFHDPEIHAVILFSHWSGDFIEFLDRPAGIEAFIQAVPERLVRIIDLCICRPSEELIGNLRAARMQCLIPFIKAKATPLLWLHFYRDLFRLLRRGRTSYLQASAELTLAYFHEFGKDYSENQSPAAEP